MIFALRGRRFDIMQLALIGNIVRDEIETFDGKSVHSWGGALYNIAVFQKLLKQGESLLPVTTVGYDVWDELMEFLSNFDRIDTSALSKSRHRNNKVSLKYIDEQERTEQAKDILPPLELNLIEQALDANAILFNFISGFEMKYEHLKKIRAEFEGTMLIDVHSLMLGIDDEGIRFKKTFPEWRKWLSCFDCVQMNAVEAGLITDSEKQYDGYTDLADDLVNTGTKVVNITLGQEGSYIAYRHDGAIESDHLEATVTERTVDPTGCGDAYSAAFLIEYMRGKSPLSAARTANHIAGIKSSVSGIEGLLSKEFDNAINNIMESD